MKSSEEVVMAYVRQLEEMEEEVSRLLSEVSRVRIVPMS